jgi:hypothetical protein
LCRGARTAVQTHARTRTVVDVIGVVIINIIVIVVVVVIVVGGVDE